MEYCRRIEPTAKLVKGFEHVPSTAFESKLGCSSSSSTVLVEDRKFQEKLRGCRRPVWRREDPDTIQYTSDHGISVTFDLLKDSKQETFRVVSFPQVLIISRYLTRTGEKSSRATIAIKYRDNIAASFHHFEEVCPPRKHVQASQVFLFLKTPESKGGIDSFSQVLYIDTGIQDQKPVAFKHRFLLNPTSAFLVFYDGLLHELAGNRYRISQARVQGPSVSTTDVEVRSDFFKFRPVWWKKIRSN